MIHLTIDGESIAVEPGTTILEAARRLNVHIPTLCYHEDQAVKAVCRICVVEVEGQRLLPAACSTPVSEGMVVKTASPKVIKARKNIMELILVRHPQDCLVCSKNGSCELQKIARDLNMNQPNRYELKPRDSRFDNSSPSLIRDMSKCILCNRCVETCTEKQGVMVMAKENRGFETVIVPPYGKKLEDTSCVNCGQCIQVCPVGAISVRDNTDDVYEQIAAGKYMVIQIAPSVRITLGESLGYAPGTVTTGKIVHALRKIGFHKVFDSDFSADLTIMEEGTELLHRIQNGGPLPLITSCCPAWVKYCENKYPEFVPNLSTCRSPQQMFGAVVREYYKDPEKNEGKKIVSVSIMPCTAKKEEILRPESYTNGKQDVDYVLTTTEIVRMIRKSGIVFDKVEIEAADVPFGIGSGSGVIFGVTGGVTEAVLRRLQQGHNRVDMESIKKSGVRGDDGIKVLTYNYNGREIKAAVVNGLANADKVLQQIKNHEAEYDFVEVMACRRGCIMGGGQPVNAGPRTRKARMKGLYDTDVNTQIKKSNENPMILSLYDTLLKGKEHELLHRNFSGK